MLSKFRPLIRDKKDQLLLVAFVFVGIFIVCASFMKTASPTEVSPDPTTADTVIPKGFVLVPVEIQNIETIGSMIGNFGVVDLFTTPQPQQKGGIRVAKHIRLLRAPLNPQTYAVLVPEAEAHDLLATQGPYTAVIQNPDTQSPTEVMRKSVIHSSVQYFKGGSHVR